jgi:DNA-binding transcriptional LysR family regulator
VTAPVDIGSVLLAEVSARFVVRYPEVRIDAHLTNRRVDLVGEGFDLALRAMPAPPKDSSMVARKLGQGELCFFASPAYVARRGAPRVLGDPEHEWIWFRSFDARRMGIKHAFTPRIVGDDFSFVREAARAGAGIGAMPLHHAEAALAAGELVRVLGPVTLPGAGLYLVYPSSKNIPRKVTAFRDFLLDWLRTHPLAAVRPAGR